MSDRMRCLAVMQPWAWAIVAGAKDIENRSWKTDYRGPVVIQASSTKTVVNGLAKEHQLRPREFSYGALIGVADLVDVIPLSEKLEANPWAFGPRCWIFRNARAFQRPISLKGKLNLYVLADDVAQKARAEIASAATLTHGEEDRAWLDAIVRSDVSERAEAHLESYIDLGDGSNALRLAHSRLATARTAETLADLARAQLATGDVAGALQTATVAIDAASDNAWAWYVRSLVYDALAGRDAAKAAELDPHFADDDDADTGVSTNDEE